VGPANPGSFSQASVDAIFTRLNNSTASADGTRRIALGFDFWVMYDGNLPLMLQSLDALLLALSLTNDLPVSLSIDATQWWSMRPDVWNWGNQDLAGYDPSNINNVEWTSWPTAEGIMNATSVSWRNWGTTDSNPVRMGAAAPNLMSPAYRAACAEEMGPLAARVGDWYAALPDDKKYLLAYVRSVQELWIGTNYWYYPGGISQTALLHGLPRTTLPLESLGAKTGVRRSLHSPRRAGVRSALRLPDCRGPRFRRV